MFGVGGGLVMVPGMVLLMSMPQHRAHATSVAAIVVAAAAAVVPLALDGKVHWDAAGLLLIGGMTGAFLGARLISRIPEAMLAQSLRGHRDRRRHPDGPRGRRQRDRIGCGLLTERPLDDRDSLPRDWRQGVWPRSSESVAGSSTCPPS